MKITSTLLTAALFILFGSMQSQINLNPAQAANWNPNLLGTPSANCMAVKVANTNPTNPKGGGNDQVQNGNGTVATIYTMTACGLNYVLGEVKTGKRYFPAAANQPVSMPIAGIPVCKQILRAYLYVGGSGNGLAFSTTMTNPAATSSVFPMTMIGTHIDKCWGYAGTYNYRADVTALITGNGNYVISGVPTSISTPGNDMDGASLVIIYADPTQNYTGHIVIGDGCQVNNSTFGIVTNTLTGFTSCAASTFANAFYIISDLQNINPTGLNMNSAANNFTYPAASNKWWDNIQAPANAVTAGQNQFFFGATNTGDCYNIVTEGVYWRTNCNVCTAGGMTVNTVVSSSCTIGSATAIVTGGNAPYSYTWTPTALNTSVITNVAPGNYTVTVKDASGCLTATALAVIPISSTTLAVNSATICLGKTATLTAVGGNTYTWTPAATLNSANGNPVFATPAATTIYTVTGTNTLGCTGTAVATVVVNLLPVIAVNNPTTCVGSTFTLTAITGTAFAWTGPNAFNTPVQNPSFANAQTTHSGNYTVVVTSAQGCTNSAVANVSVIANPTINVTGTNTMCSQNFNASPNSVVLTANGGNSYQWTLPPGFSASPNTSSNPITLTPPITAAQVVATMTVVGTIGTCTNQAVYQVTVYPNPTIAVTSASMCAGTQVTLTANNATTYTWSPATALTSTSGPVVIANPANTTVYSVIGSSIGGCKSQTQNSTVTVVPNPTVTINPNPALICLGSSVNLAAVGATNYTWSPNIALTTTLGPNTTANPSVTITYTIIGSQATCTNLATVQVSVIGLPTVSIAGTNTLCSQNFNGSPATTTLTASGAGTYVWTLPPGFSGSPSLSSNPLVITPPITSVPMVATMTVLGTAGTCTSLAVFNLTVVPNPTIATTSGSMCAGTSVNLTASNATTYTWTPSATLNTSNGPSVIASPAVTTVYSIIGSSVGCNSQTQNATANVVANPTVTILPNPAVICLNQAINLTASGANNYTWSPNLALTTTNGPNTTANPTVTTVYQVIGEAATCTHVANITVSVLPLPTITIVPSSPTLCMNNFNGSPNTVSLTANGAASYTWGPIIGLTTNTLNGSMIIGTSNGNPIATGTVIGANGTCTTLSTFTVNAIPNPIIAVTSASMCAGTSATLTASNAITYTWSPSTTLNTAFGSNVIASPAVTTLYSVIGGSAGCNSQTQNGVVTVVNNPTVSIAPTTPTICFGSSINLTASGANNYTWSPNTAISSTVGNAVTVNPTVTTVYSIIGEASTCTNTAAQTVTVIPLPIINIGLSNGIMCMNSFNGSNNQITVTASGATSYNWIGFTGIGNSTSSGPNVIVTAIPNSPIGTGTVIGTVGTCTSMASFTIIAIPNPVIAVTSASMCLGTSATLNASGATTYVWSPGNTLNQTTGSSVIANPANSTVYSVIGTSLNCNSTTQTGTVDVVPNPIIVIAPVTPTICAGDAIGLSAFGATNYTWAPSNTLNTAFGANVIASPMVTTNYIVIGEAATCTSTAIRQVQVIQLPTLQAICDRTVICLGDKTNINANGANSYTWNPPYGLTSSSSNFVVANPTSSMNYTLIGTNGICTASLSVPIIVLQKPLLNLTTSAPRICMGNKSTIFASGAQTYSWEPMADSTVANYAIVSPSVSTNYTVTGVNFSGTVGCAFTKEILVEVVPQVTASISNSVVICEGESVKLNAGGSNTYVWVPGASLSNSLVAQPYANPKVTTEYTVYVSNGGNCASKATVMVKVHPMPVVDAGPDLSFNSDEPMYLSAKGTGTLSWILGDGIMCHVCPNSQFTTKQSGVYQIQAVSEYGCRAIDEVNIEITNEYSIYIPNIFTPNFDGKNDTFLVFGVGITDIQVTIFDRWGEQLYHDENQTTGWDGTYRDELGKNDVYIYLVKYTALDGKKHTKSGHVTLLK